MKSIPQLLIAAPSSGSGKTTIARGLMALFSDKGLKVQPYKCGPDYIDTKFHTQVCGRPSVNLDTFMATPEHVKAVYAHYMDGADACLVEGMMGMYDGYDRDRGSSAEIASLLGIPVVLVVDARSAAYSIAPLLSGFVHFRDDVNICGVIFNKVGSARHYAMLQQVCDDLHIECFGYLPKSASLEQGSRYLGLDFSQEAEFRQLVALLDEHVTLAGHGDVQTVGHPVLLGAELDLRRGVPALLRPSRRHGDRLAGARRVHGPAPRAAAAQRLARCLRQPDRRSHGRNHRFARHLAQRAGLQPAEGGPRRDEAPGAGRAGLHRPPVQPRQVAVPAADPGHLHGPDHQLETGGRRGPRDPSLHA